MSRPTLYNEKTAQSICLHLIEGQSLRQICQSDSMPCIATVFNWMKSQPEFLEQYARARELQTDVFIDEIIDIADRTENDVQRDRLRIDSRKWIASKLKPKKYGAFKTIEYKDQAKTPVDPRELTSNELMLVIKSETTPVKPNEIKQRIQMLEEALLTAEEHGEAYIE